MEVIPYIHVHVRAPRPRSMVLYDSTPLVAERSPRLVGASETSLGVKVTHKIHPRKQRETNVVRYDVRWIRLEHREPMKNIRHVCRGGGKFWNPTDKVTVDRMYMYEGKIIIYFT